MSASGYSSSDVLQGEELVLLDFVHVGKKKKLPVMWKAVFRGTKFTPNVVKACLKRSNVQIIHDESWDAEDYWIGSWGRRLPHEGLAFVPPLAKLNHFPSSGNLGRKDYLALSLNDMMSRIGPEEYSFVPRTYVSPEQIQELGDVMDSAPRGTLWICKPAHGCQAECINLTETKFGIPEIPCVVQQFVDRPLTIKGRKFDLRLYVAVTSWSPLRAYLYDNGLVRLANQKYDPTMKDLDAHSMFLTNVSVNKHEAAYAKEEEDGKGSKWSVAALRKHFEEEGITQEQMWRDVDELIVKTLLAVEHKMNVDYERYRRRGDTSYELFGFDVLLDVSLKPWLMEVNVSPSLASPDPIDKIVKRPLIVDLFNLVLFVVPKRPAEREEHLLRNLSHEYAMQSFVYAAPEPPKSSRGRHAVIDWESISEEEKCVLAVSDLEYSRRGSFRQIFPVHDSYDRYISRGYISGERSQRLNAVLSEWIRCTRGPHH